MTKISEEKVIKKKIKELKHGINLLLSDDLRKICDYNEDVLRRNAYGYLNTLRNSLHRHLIIKEGGKS